jgi:predicted exporter
MEVAANLSAACSAVVRRQARGMVVATMPNPLTILLKTDLVLLILS